MIAVLYVTIGLLFLAGAIFAVYRMAVGPSILDRVIASDMLLTTLILVVGTDMVYNGHTRNIPLMLVLATTAIFGTVAVARYVANQDRDTGVDIEPDSADAADGIHRAGDDA